MQLSTSQQRRALEQLSSDEKQKYQLERLNQLIEKILPTNDFYQQKFKGVSFPLMNWEQIQELPVTTKEELQQASGENLASTNRTFPVDQYVRFHQTSGTTGKPLMVLDTAEDWKWWLSTWQYVLDAAELTNNDRVMMAFSFGPFIGFWSAHDAVIARGCLTIPGGGLTSVGRLELIRNSQTTVVFCTPSYALHLAEVAQDQNIKLGELPVRCLVLAGEPGGSVPAIRERIEEAWQAKVCDHAGATEIGPWGYANLKADASTQGLFVNEAEFIAEFETVGFKSVDGAPQHSESVGENELSAMIITNLGRVGYPVIRYRTGDLVRPTWQQAGNNRFVFLQGGVLGRADDMMIIRGVNIYPSAIEGLLRSFPEVQEFRMIATTSGEMDQLTIEVEDELSSPERIAKSLQMKLNLRVEVACVPLGSLPRYELKGKRFVDQR